MKNMRILLSVLSLIWIGSTELNAQTVKDIEGNEYHTVTIGTQTWMVENLKTTKFNDGISIPNITDNNEWANLKSPGYCWTSNQPGYKDIYGALYNWYTVKTGKLAPKGWHVPSYLEWSTLVTYLGGEVIAGGKLKETGTEHWHNPNTGATNETGFTALPGGLRDEIKGEFYDRDGYGYWWSSVEKDATYGWGWGLDLFKSDMLKRYNPKGRGLSVRCIKD
jgi:uncharacterized protein (TIGR02145 family)